MGYLTLMLEHHLQSLDKKPNGFFVAEVHGAFLLSKTNFANENYNCAML